MTTDDFIPENYLKISSDIENSIKSNKTIQIHKDAAWLRCAVSRAYYSAFLSLRTEFEKHPQLNSRLEGEYSDHKIILQILNGLGRDKRTYANKFFNLRKNRNHCDYDLPETWSISIGIVEISNANSSFLINSTPHIVNLLNLN